MQSTAQPLTAGFRMIGPAMTNIYSRLRLSSNYMQVSNDSAYLGTGSRWSPMVPLRLLDLKLKSRCVGIPEDNYLAVECIIYCVVSLSYVLSNSMTVRVSRKSREKGNSGTLMSILGPCLTWQTFFPRNYINVGICLTCSRSRCHYYSGVKVF